MIISELKINDKTKLPKLTQRVDIKCDVCDATYNVPLINRNKGILIYEKDLCRSCKQKEQYLLGHRDKQKDHIASYATNVQKGKTFDILYGKEKSDLIKSSISSAMSKDNPRWSTKYRSLDEIEDQRKRQSIQFSMMKKDKTYEEQYGIEKANLIKDKLTKSMTGELNHMYGKPAPKKSGNGWSGWFKNHYFRSLMEFTYLYYLLENNINFENGELKKFKILYSFNDKMYNYYPDFYLVDIDTYIEVKPKSLLNTAKNIAKINAAKSLHNDKFIIITEDNLKYLKPLAILQMYENGDILFDDKDIIKKGLEKIKNNKYDNSN